MISYINPMTSEHTIHHALLNASQRLAHTISPQLDAEILLAHALQKPRSYLLAWPEQLLTSAQNQTFEQLLARRLQGESVAHLLGEKEFWSLTLSITSDTLIPRPDTELLVELVLKILPTDAEKIVADLGTGSGAIALAIASERPNWQIIATDNYSKTLDVAKYNAAQLKINNIYFYLGDWCDALPKELAGKINIIVSNPPYIAADDPHLHAPELLFEPQHALVSAQNGYDDLNKIVDQAKYYLVVGGWLLLEHGFNQAPLVQQYMHQAGYCHINTHPDLSGHPRVTVGQWL